MEGAKNGISSNKVVPPDTHAEFLDFEHVDRFLRALILQTAHTRLLFLIKAFILSSLVDCT